MRLRIQKETINNSLFSFVSNTQQILPIIIYRVFIENCVFFPIHCNPSPACRRTTQPRKRSECTVTLIG